MERKVVISKEVREKGIYTYLKAQGYDVVLHGPVSNVDSRISCHPDLVYCKLTDDVCFVGDEEKLGENYPMDVRFNACSTGKFFIHTLKYTDEELLRKAEELGLEFVDVPQGYARCNILPIDENSIITSDKGVADSLEGKLDVLLIQGKVVKLEGFPYGFIGGCAGRVGDKIIFNGNLQKHPDFERIMDFITSKGLKVKYFESYALEDAGSIIEVNI